MKWTKLLSSSMWRVMAPLRRLHSNVLQERNTEYCSLISPVLLNYNTFLLYSVAACATFRFGVTVSRNERKDNKTEIVPAHFF